jgi:hypothetical protein
MMNSVQGTQAVYGQCSREVKLGIIRRSDLMGGATDFFA